MASADRQVARWDGSTSGAVERLERHQRALWAVVALALLADTALTAYGLHVGMFEANPIMRSAVAAFGTPGLLLPKAAALFAAVGIRAAVSERLRAVVPATLATPWLVAAGVNLVGIASL